MRNIVSNIIFIMLETGLVAATSGGGTVTSGSRFWLTVVIFSAGFFQDFNGLLDHLRVFVETDASISVTDVTSRRGGRDCGWHGRGWWGRGNNNIRRRRRRGLFTRSPSSILNIQLVLDVAWIFNRIIIVKNMPWTRAKPKLKQLSSINCT